MDTEFKDPLPLLERLTSSKISDMANNKTRNRRKPWTITPPRVECESAPILDDAVIVVEAINVSSVQSIDWIL